MLTCPMCKKALKALVRECPTCRSDLTLLADFVTHLQEGMAKADALAKAGELGEATWAYLAVLEVDPENAQARRQVGLVATAIRQFDKTAPARRWLRFRVEPQTWRTWALGGLAALFALFIGFAAGRNVGPALTNEEEPEPVQKKPKENTAQ